MTHQEFSFQMDRMLKTYGERNYPNERMDAIFERVKGIPVKTFDRAVTYLIGEHFSPPSVSKIVEACGNFREPGERQNYTPYKFRCPPCSDLGFGWVGHKIVKCSCPLGQSHTEERIAQEQANYDKGRKLFPSPFDSKDAKPRLGALFHELPYDPSERIAE